MTIATATGEDLLAGRLLTGPVLRLFATYLGAMCSFYLLLSVVPLYADTHHLGTATAGLTTAAMMFAAVATEVATPGLVRRLGCRRLLGIGLVLLGIPAAAMPVLVGASSPSGLGGLDGAAALTVLTAARGVGFGFLVVCVGTLAAHTFPASRRGEGFGILGVVAMVPAITALPLGVWLTSTVGYDAVFAGAALVALASLPLLGSMSDSLTGEATQLRQRYGLRDPALARPLVVFAATAIAGGVVIAFLPGAVVTDLAAIGLFTQAATATASRWWAGRRLDRAGGAGLLAGGVAASALGMALTSMTGSTTSVIGGMVLFGIGFGVAQAASLSLMLRSVDPAGYATVSAAWNASYDIGWGLGALAIGVVVTQLGHSAAFAVTAALVAPVLFLIPRATYAPPGCPDVRPTGPAPSPTA